MINAKQARAIMKVDKDTFESCISWADTWIKSSAIAGKTEIRLMTENSFRDLTPARAKGTQQAIVKFLEEQGFKVKEVSSNGVVEWYASWDEEN